MKNDELGTSLSQKAGLKGDVHWRDSARSIRFFIWDGKASFPLFVLILHISWWTFGMALLAMVFFTALNRFGFSPMVFARWLRGLVAGPHKRAIPWWQS